MSKPDLQQTYSLNLQVNLAASDEKDLSTAQPPTKTNARFFGAHGHPWRTQDTQATARERPRSARDIDPAEAARLARGAAGTFESRGRQFSRHKSASIAIQLRYGE
jgi:hypothetical protein